MINNYSLTPQIFENIRPPRLLLGVEVFHLLLEIREIQLPDDDLGNPLGPIHGLE